MMCRLGELQCIKGYTVWRDAMAPSSDHAVSFNHLVVLSR